MKVIAQTIVVASILVNPVLTFALPVVAAQPGKEVELTQVDLFSLSGWESRQVAVDRFSLGITRTKAFEIAEANGLRLKSDTLPGKARGTRTPCRESSCSVYEMNGNWIGVNIFFEADSLTKIRVSVPVDADPKVKQASVARKFKGLTYEFFNNYSESLRNRLLGPTEAKETPLTAGNQASALSLIEYQYPRLGMVVRTTIDKRDQPPVPFDLEVDFVIPQQDPRT